jgi:hypothetical protein
MSGKRSIERTQGLARTHRKSGTLAGAARTPELSASFTTDAAEGIDPLAGTGGAAA